MQTLYDENAPKKPTNLSINNDLLTKSKKLGINLSATLESALRSQLADAEAKDWVKNNRTAIRAYNDTIENHGCFSDEHRTF